MIYCEFVTKYETYGYVVISIVALKAKIFLSCLQSSLLYNHLV